MQPTSNNKKLRNIDVTLRDGGYQNNFTFPEQYIIKHIENLSKAGVEYIEIGYRNGAFKPIPNIGITGLSPNYYIENIRNHVPSAKLVIIAHPSNITKQDLHDLHDLGISLIRLCVNKKDPRTSFELCNYARGLGLTVSLNVTRASQESEKFLVQIGQEAEHNGAHIFYLADSNGSMLPRKIITLFSLLKEKLSIDLGFHAHNNLDMAMANSIAALQAGATFIDSSLLGMGKGAGNLKLNMWLSLINLTTPHTNYNIPAILEQTDILQNQDFYKTPTHHPIDLILAFNNLSVEYQETLESRLHDGIANAFQAAQHLKTKAG